MGEASRQKQWEYMCVKVLGTYAVGEAIEKFNPLGKEGWELVSVCVQFTSHFAYFKRRRALGESGK